MRITVLRGGPSAEREVSLVSGAAVAKGLREMGHEVFESDVSPKDLRGLDKPADIIFPVLHGQFGESGELQAILEQRKLAFVGSGSAASRLGMDKIATKQVWEQEGLPTPPYLIKTRTGVDPHGLILVKAPCVVKAVSSGSSIDVFVCRKQEDADRAVQTVLAKEERVLVEMLIDGPELTVGLLEEQPLAPIRIVAKGEFFDFKAKYQSNETQHLFDTGLPPQVVEKCRQLAKQANQVLGARDLARIDIMLDAQHNPYLLEINTLPGFTPKSLLPEAAAQAGIAFPQLVDRLARRAYDRHRKTRAA